MRKMLASDIDGTLFIDGKIDEQSISKLKELKKQGHALILCTGRDFSGTKNLFDGHDIEVDALVLCNGALILDKDFNEERALNIDENTAVAISEELGENKEYSIAFMDGYNLYLDMDEDMRALGAPLEEHNIKVLNPKELEGKYDSIKLMSVVNKAQSIEIAEKIKDYINDTYGEYVIAYRNMFFVDIVPKGCSKAYGIESVASKFEILEDDIFVIGDSWNDLSMFERYKNSYTFTRCEEELKKSANNIVDKFHNCVEDIIA